MKTYKVAYWVSCALIVASAICLFVQFVGWGEKIISSFEPQTHSGSNPLMIFLCARLAMVFGLFMGLGTATGFVCFLLPIFAETEIMNFCTPFRWLVSAIIIAGALTAVSKLFCGAILLFFLGCAPTLIFRWEFARTKAITQKTIAV